MLKQLLENLLYRFQEWRSRKEDLYIQLDRRDKLDLNT
jgi:hypothetical protein